VSVRFPLNHGRVARLSAILVFVCASGAAPSAFAQVPVQIPPAAAPSANISITQGIWAWQRTEYSDNTTVAPSNPNNYTITFRPDGRAVIQADCNTGSAGYTITGSQLALQPAAVSLVACPPGSLDSVFLRDLSQVATYVINGDQLVLNLRLDTGNMIFSPLPPASLTGVTWRVTGVNNGRGGLVSTLPDTQLTATFGDDGRVNGDTGCNMYFGPYSVVGSSITFGPLATTRRACLSDAANAQEQEFLAALGASSTYELVGDRLTLRDDGGAMQLTLVRPTN
jgi:heat shock protein HslJ